MKGKNCLVPSCKLSFKHYFLAIRDLPLKNTFGRMNSGKCVAVFLPFAHPLFVRLLPLSCIYCNFAEEASFFAGGGKRQILKIKSKKIFFSPASNFKNLPTYGCGWVFH
jgi:hypothetical protein